VKIKATCLLAFMVLGQFLACLWSTQQFWPFNPILVYVEPIPDQVSETSLVAFKGRWEQDIVTLGWTNERVRGRLAAIVRQADTPEERAEKLAQIIDCYRPMAHDWQGIRLYKLTWDLKRGTLTQTQLLSEASF
jgi:hypothetical protein